VRGLNALVVPYVSRPRHQTRANNTKSEIKGQINTQNNVDREKVKSGSIKEMALDSDCFRLMKNQAISICDLI
jgi:hypothetical protein